jgi:hypothetical protein
LFGKVKMGLRFGKAFFLRHFYLQKGTYKNWAVSLLRAVVK